MGVMEELGIPVSGDENRVVLVGVRLTCRTVEKIVNDGWKLVQYNDYYKNGRPWRYVFEKV